MNTTENNKFIDLWMAEFEEHESDKLTIINDLENKGASPQSYHNDWNLLMLVVEKIETLLYEVVIKRGFCEIEAYTYNPEFSKIHVGLKGSKREATYQAVTEFIKWYNEQQ